MDYYDETISHGGLRATQSKFSITRRVETFLVKHCLWLLQAALLNKRHQVRMLPTRTTAQFNGRWRFPVGNP